MLRNSLLILTLLVAPGAARPSCTSSQELAPAAEQRHEVQGPVAQGLDELFDCNNNGIDDSVDISIGSSVDANQNGVPDECEHADCRHLQR